MDIINIIFPNLYTFNNYSCVFLCILYTKAIYFQIFFLYLGMALLKYFKLKWHDIINKECLPDVNGPLSIEIPTESICC